MLWFTHDTDAYYDKRIQALRIEHGGAAVDAYYAILEEIYRKETDLVLCENQSGTKAVTYRLCTDWETLKTWFSTMGEIGLLEVTENEQDGSFSLHSLRAAETIESYQRKSETARENGKKGGRPKGSKTQVKPRKTKSVNSANQRLTQEKAKREDRSVLDSHKGYPNTHAEHGADAGRPAPRSARKCPKCQGEMRPTNSKVPGTERAIWRCDACGEEASDE